MLSQSVYTLVNQQNGNLSFKVFEFDNSSYFDHIQRNNYFTLIIITSGEGLAKVDLCEYPFEENTMFAFYPYQPFMLASKQPLVGVAIQFHHDFFCITDTIKRLLPTASCSIIFMISHSSGWMKMQKEHY